MPEIGRCWLVPSQPFVPVDLVPRAFLFGQDMHDKDPSTYGWLIYLGFAGLSGWGAVVAYLRKVRMGRKFRWRELALDLLCAPFIGVIAGMVCIGMNMPLPLAFALSGLAGHAGPRILGKLTDSVLRA